ncbi:MAG: ATP-binding protein [Ignavibacteriales bacterium]|nr:ATP-binding protein [Ignavibacteriales bacterium]
METTASTKQTEPIFPSLAKALQSELEQLKKTRGEIVLFSGEQVGSVAGHYYYRFEIPEDLLLRFVERVSFTLGSLEPLTFQGKIVSHENQYLTVALPVDCGSVLPEIKCTWSNQDQLRPAIDILTSLDGTTSLASLLFNPSGGDNNLPTQREPEALPDTSQDRSDALRKILANRVTYVWGPVQSGKRRVLSLAAASWLKSGKRVLYVSSSNEFVDEAVIKTVEVCKQLGLDTMNMTRVGLPLNQHAEALGATSFEVAVETAKAEKRKTFQERVLLLETYWRTKVRHALHEDSSRKVSELRERLAAVKKQLDQASKDVGSLKETIHRIENASMMERLKKGFTKEDLAAAQRQFGEKQQVLKRLTATQQALSNEILKVESESPISFEEGKNYREASKRIEELGGIEKVTQTVEDFTKVDEAALLKSKVFVGTTASTALSHPTLRATRFDFVIVDDAGAILLPQLAALATLAKDSIVVSGDPFQLPPEPLSTGEVAQEWLYKDIFLHASKTDDLHRLFEWAEKNPQWSVLLASQYTTTPKLTSFVAGILFDDKLNVFASPQAKGKIVFIDTSDLRSECKQYIGKKKILPSNELQTRRTVECVKYLLMERSLHASDIGVVLPFSGPTFFTKLQLRTNGLKNIEVGVPQTFRGRRKRDIVFDTAVAGMDFTMRPMDDRKVGDNKIARFWNTVFSCVAEDIYVLADMNLFKTLYKDRLFAKILMLLQGQSDPLPSFATSAKKFDELESDKRSALLSVARKVSMAGVQRTAQPQQAPKVDHEMEMKMKMLAKQQAAAKPQSAARNFEREIYLGVQRILGVRMDLNLLSQYLGGDLLFRHSIQTEEFSARLPIDQCQSEKDFRSLMERWNLFIYETSGGGKTDLSFFAKGSPETRIRHDIRNMKIFYSSDMETAIEEGKQKIAVEVSRVFQETLGKAQPGNPIEWSTVYVNFLTKLESYLGWISAQLRK